MAIAALSFGTPSPIPAAPATGKKLFLGADGRFAVLAPDGTTSSIGGGLEVFLTKTNFPATGELDRLYVAEDELTAYKWTGTAYVQLNSSLDAGVY